VAIRVPVGWLGPFLIDLRADLLQRLAPDHLILLELLALTSSAVGHGLSSDQNESKTSPNSQAAGSYAEHSPSITTGSNAWLSPRSMKSSGVVCAASSSTRSFSRSAATDGVMRRENAPSSSVSLWRCSR